MAQSGPNPSSGSGSDGKKQNMKYGRRKSYYGKHKNRKEIYKYEQIVNSKTTSNYTKEYTAENVNLHSQNGKKPQRNNNTGQIQRTSKKRDKDHFRLSIDKSKRELSIQRENELSQCIRVFSNKNFKILKRGQYATSYGFIINRKFLGIPNCKFIIDIPLDYPHSSIKLNYAPSNAQYDKSLEEKLGILIENFNSKSIQLLAGGKPIISQLNYLVEKAEILSRRDYGSIDKREQAFFGQFA